MIDKAELERPRTAAEMLAWVNAAAERFNATTETKAAARLGRLGAKELWGEARPIALFAYRYFDASPQVTITHVIGNQNYDATVDDRREYPARVDHRSASLNQSSEESFHMKFLDARLARAFPFKPRIKQRPPRGGLELFRAVG